MITLEIRHEFRDIKFGSNEFYITNFFKKLFLKLKDTFPNINFVINNKKEYEKFGQGGIYSCMNFTILNPNNGKYILFSFFDNWRYHFMYHLGWDAEKMEQFFYPGGFNFLDYYRFKDHSKNNSDLKFPSNINGVYQQFFYGPYFDCCYEEIENLYNESKNIQKEKKLFFRGWLWDFRKKMTENLQSNEIIIIDKNENNQNLDYVSFLKESIKYTSVLSLPGGNEMCNRDVECFGIGVPVIRPSLNINYPNPLIPNYHYISCYDFCDYGVDGHPKYNSYEDFKKSLVSTWNKVKNNQDYLNFVSENARQWFKENCIIDKNIEYVTSKIKIDKIF